MSKIFADLHSHTFHSDGTYSPNELAGKFKHSGVHVFSITDHDTISAYKYLDTDLKFILGCELTCYFENKEIHLLAYGFDSNNNEIENYFSILREQREERAADIIKQLHIKDVQITFEELKKEFPKSMLTRSHIASLMAKKGIVNSPFHAFKKLLSNEHLNIPKLDFLKTEDAIKLIRKYGGFTSLAHPGNFYSDLQLYSLVKSGLDSVEVKHPSNKQSTEKRLKSFAKQYSINSTGGSDYHGRNQNEEKYLGKYGLNEEQFDKLNRKFKLIDP